MCLNYSDLDNELPLSSIADFLHPIDNHIIEKSEVQKCKTVDCKTKQNIKQDNKFSHPSIPEVLQPNVNFEILKSGSHKYENLDYQTEANNNQDNKQTLSSIDNKFIKCELKKYGAFNYQSKVHINPYHKSDPFSKICKNQQSTINNQMRIYECGICGNIYYKRILIIKHFKISCCFPG